jgi:hypothetical protein
MSHWKIVLYTFLFFEAEFGLLKTQLARTGHQSKEFQIVFMETGEVKEFSCRRMIVPVK